MGGFISKEVVVAVLTPPSRGVGSGMVKQPALSPCEPSKTDIDRTESPLPLHVLCACSFCKKEGMGEGGGG